MKKITFDTSGGSGHQPFWNPWGPWGCLWRFLVFLAMLFLLFGVLSLFKKCNSNKFKDFDDTEIPDSIYPPKDDPRRHVEPIDTVPRNPFEKDFDDPGPNLPDPEDNYIPPVEPGDTITDPDTGRKYAGDRLNVILDSKADDSTFKQWAAEFKEHYPGDEYEIVYYNPLTKTLQIQVPKEERDAIKKALPEKITDISFKVFDESFYTRAAAKPNDPAFEVPQLCWYFAPIQAYEACEITTGSSDVRVAVIDSYFDVDHVELGGSKISSPYNVPRKNTDLRPPAGTSEEDGMFFHGSMVASMAVAKQNNSAGASGIAPDCTLIPISIGDYMGNLAMLDAILYAIYQEADVINLSIGQMWGEGASELPLEDQIRFAEEELLVEQDVWDYVFGMADERNVTIVWAAGNDNLYTAMDATKRNYSTIKVSALDPDLHKAFFSDFGNFKEHNVEMSTISAPGMFMFGAMPWNTYVSKEGFQVSHGTSYAAPVVTGAVALMKSLDKSLSNKEIIQILQETGKPIEGPEGTTIGNMIQIRDALMRIKGGMAKSDEVMDDHSKLKGLWQSTELLKQYTDGKFNGNQCRLYFQIDSETSGSIIYYTATSTKKEYTAPVSLKWESSKVTITQNGNATCPSDPLKFSPCSFATSADSKGLLLVNLVGNDLEFNLRQVKEIEKE